MTTTRKRVVAGPSLVDRECYTDPAIFEREMESIFERTWIFIAHASEVASPGDYRTAEIGGQPVIAIRGTDGKVRVFYNSCRHKGHCCGWLKGAATATMLPVSPLDIRHARQSVSVPRVEAYGPELDPSRLGLIELPSVGEIYGLVFCSINPNVESLESYIGSATPYLKEVAHYIDDELETIGVYDYIYNGNWKLLMENTLDDYHAEYLHDYAFAQRADLFEMQGTSGFPEKEGARVSVELGIHGAYDQTDDERTLKIQRTRPRRVYLSVFPSLIVLYYPVWDVTGFRVIVPISVTRPTCSPTCLAPRSADPEKRKVGSQSVSTIPGDPAAVPAWTTW